MNDLSHLISEPTRIPNRSGDKANTLDLFLTSNPDIYCNPILDSLLGNSDQCLITLQHNFVYNQDRSSSSQKVFHNSKADWDSLRNFFAAYPWYSGLFIGPSSFAAFITEAIQLGMALFIPSSYKSGKKSSPKWFTSQCAKAVQYKTTTLNNGNDTKLSIQELYLYNLVTYAPKTSLMPNPLLSNASTIKLLHIKQDLAPSGPWLSQKTFAILLFHL